MKSEHERIRKIYSDKASDKFGNADNALPRLMGSVGAIAFVLGLMIMAMANTMNIFVLGLTGLGLLLLLAFIAIDFKNVKMFLTSRTTIYSTNFLIVVAALLGIMIIINAVASNHYVSIDLTSEKVNSLSGQTLKILNDIKSSKRSLKMIVFLSKTDPRQIEIDLLLQNYVHFAPSLKYSFADYEIQKKLAMEKGVDRACVVIEIDDASKRIYDFDERSITAGILALIRPEQKVVGLITGHGEFNAEGEGGRSISSFVSNLEKENYIVKVIDIASENGIPPEVSTVLIIGAQKSFNDREIELLKVFERKGGSIALFLEPFAEDGLQRIYESWGIENLPDMVIDTTDNYFEDETVPVIKTYTYHPITASFLDKQLALGGFIGGVIIPTATSLKVKEKLPAGVDAISLALTSEKSWGETSADEMDFNRETDIAGPLTVAVVGTKKTTKESTSQETSIIEGDIESNAEIKDQTQDGENKKEGEEGLKPDTEKTPEVDPAQIQGSRFLVIGDADILTDASIREASNFDFVLNSINWLNEDEGLIEIRSSINMEKRIDLEKSQAKAIQIINLFIPLLIAGIGIARWLKRR